MSRIKTAAALMAASALLAAAAARAETYDIAGVYDLTTPHARGADGKPVCTERWTLGPDGAFVIESGQEQVRGRWALAGGAKTGWKIAFRGQTTNGLADCMGHTATKPPKPVDQYFYFNVDDNLVLTPPPGRNPDGSLIYQPDALLTKVAKP